MSVYNGGTYLRPAIQSILEQTFSDFEFIIVNDGSTDESLEIIRSFSDSRIRLIENEKNMGLIYSLNRGIDLASGEYIARMDSDDISLPNRLKKQVAFMDANYDVAVCGTWIKTIGDESGFVKKYFTDSEEIKASLLFNTSVAHPTVIIRTSILKKYNFQYEESHKHFEDYALWVKISRIARLANIPEALLLYRVHQKSISHVMSKEQKDGAENVRKEQIKDLGIFPSPEEMNAHNSLICGEKRNLALFLSEKERWFLKILEKNGQAHAYKRWALKKILYERWRTACGMNANFGFSVWKKYQTSPLFKFGGKKKYWDSVKILTKSLF